MKEIEKQDLLQQLPSAEEVDSSLLPSYWESVASVSDLYGILLIHLIEKFSEFGDHEALKSDWVRVGQDIRDIMFRTQNELGMQLKKTENITMEEAFIEVLDKINAEIESEKVVSKKRNEQTKASTQ